jgi:hypothetical protein
MTGYTNKKNGRDRVLGLIKVLGLWKGLHL